MLAAEAGALDCSKRLTRAPNGSPVVLKQQAERAANQSSTDGEQKAEGKRDVCGRNAVVRALAVIATTSRIVHDRGNHASDRDRSEHSSADPCAPAECLVIREAPTEDFYRLDVLPLSPHKNSSMLIVDDDPSGVGANKGADDPHNGPLVQNHPHSGAGSNS